MSKRVYNKFHLLTALTTLSVLVFTVWLLKQTVNTHIKNAFEARQETKSTTKKIAVQLDRELIGLKAAADEISSGLNAPTSACERGQITTQCTEQVLSIASLNHDGFYSLGVAFNSGIIPLDQGQLSRAPSSENGCGGKHCLYAPYLVEQRGSIEKKRIDNYYDYRESERGGAWYIDALDSKPGWGPALKEPAMDEWVLKYTQPLDQNGNTIGVVFADIGLDWFRERIETHDLTHNGYAILINESLGPDEIQVLYHGLESTETIYEYLDSILAGRDRDSGKCAKESKKTVSPDFVQEVLCFPAEQSTARIVNRLTGKAAWFNRARIGKSDLFLLTVMDFPNGTELDNYYSIADIRNPESAVTEHFTSDFLKKKILNLETVSGSGIITIIICIVSLITLFFLCYYVFFWQRITLRTHIATAIAISGLFAVGIVAIWIIQYTFENQLTNASTTIPNSAVAKAFEKEYSKISLERQYAPPGFIPTGIFVQSIEFANATNVSLTGYLWQRYPMDSVIGDEPTVIFAEAITSSMVPAYRQEEGNDIVVGWYFETVLNERFNYSYFPFDRQSIWVRMWNRDFASNTVLVPDFQSYNSLNPRSIPGLELDLPLFGWIPERSYFELRMNRYNSNFGLDKYLNRSGVPELYFNIDVKRNFLNPFISHLFSLMVILLMLFAITITISKRKEGSDLLGFSVSSVIASCTALFFVVLIAHVQLRRELSANSVVYLEMFYFVSYVVILMTTVNAILFTWNVSVSFVQHGNNLIPKLLYWPFILGTMFLCTALTFWW